MTEEEIRALAVRSLQEEEPRSFPYKIGGLTDLEMRQRAYEEAAEIKAAAAIREVSKKAEPQARIGRADRVSLGGALELLNEEIGVLYDAIEQLKAVLAPAMPAATAEPPEALPRDFPMSPLMQLAMDAVDRMQTLRATINKLASEVQV